MAEVAAVAEVAAEVAEVAEAEAEVAEAEAEVAEGVAAVAEVAEAEAEVAEAEAEVAEAAERQEQAQRPVRPCFLLCCSRLQPWSPSVRGWAGSATPIRTWTRYSRSES